MLNEKLQALYQGVESVSGLKGVRFAYAMARNKLALKRELETLQEAIKASDKFIEYDKKRVDLCEQYADKDDKDEPKLENNEYVFSKANKVKFDKELDKVREEYKTVIDERTAQLKEFGELLKKESEFKPYMIAYESVPEEITTDAMSRIIELIEDPKK